MNQTTMKKAGAALAATGLLAGLGVAVASPATAGPNPSGCSMKMGINHQTGNATARGKCGTTKFTGKQVWKSGFERGSGKINKSKYSYKYAAKSSTNLKGKIGKRNVSGKLKFRSTGGGTQQFHDYGSLKYKGKSYKFSYRGTWNGNPNYKSVSVKSPNGKKLAPKTTVRTYISILVAYRHAFT